MDSNHYLEQAIPTARGQTTRHPNFFACACQYPPGEPAAAEIHVGRIW